jgi:hypothetical protein
MAQLRVRTICGGADMVERGIDLAQIEECSAQVEMGSCAAGSQRQGAPKTAPGLPRRTQIQLNATQSVPSIDQSLVEVERPTVLRRSFYELGFLLEGVGVPRRKDSIIRIPFDPFAKVRGRLARGPVRADLGGVFWSGSAFHPGCGGTQTITLAAHKPNHLH